jgi:hypothetical protein
MAMGCAYPGSLEGGGGDEFVGEEIFFLEHTILGDGRAWILGATKGPMMADIHAAWTLDFAAGNRGSA